MSREIEKHYKDTGSKWMAVKYWQIAPDGETMPRRRCARRGKGLDMATKARRKLNKASEFGRTAKEAADTWPKAGPPARRATRTSRI